MPVRDITSLLEIIPVTVKVEKKFGKEYTFNLPKWSHVQQASSNPTKFLLVF
jgi:hypothetical protein